MLSDKPQWYLTVYGPNLSELRQALEELWKAHGPPLVYDIESVDDQRADVYRQEGQITTMLAAVALLAVGIAMVGAYALVGSSSPRLITAQSNFASSVISALRTLETGQLSSASLAS
jgi:putative ABC transport system permease protein